MKENFYVCIMAGQRRGPLSTGATSKLSKRAYEHKNGMEAQADRGANPRMDRFALWLNDVGRMDSRLRGNDGEKMTKRE
jgi:predicted GIY-YIG superfamily endonuclease